MARNRSEARLRKAEALLDGRRRFVDLAVRLRILAEDGPGRLLAGADGRTLIFGGRWDREVGGWVTPQPKDLRAVEWTIQEQQVPALFGYLGGVQFLAFFGGRQSGKTALGCMCILLGALRHPGREFAVLSLDYVASALPEEALRRLIDPSWEIRERKSPHITWTLPHGAVIKSRSSEAIESIRGPSLMAVLIDEAATYCTDYVFAAIAGCGVAATLQLIASTTPRRENRWIRKIHADWPRDPACKAFKFRSWDNPRANKAFLHTLAGMIPHDLYQQEMEGEVVAPERATYYLFDRARHVLDAPPPGKDITRGFCAERFGVAADAIAGWDFGFEAVVAARIYRETIEVTEGFKTRRVNVDRAYVFDELVSGRITTEHQAAKVAATWGLNLLVLADPMGAHDRADGRGIETAAMRILREAGFAKVRGAARKAPEITQRIRAVLRLLKNARNETRLHVARKCAHLIDALENQELDESGKPKPGAPGQEYEHVLDALGYFVWPTFPIEEDMPAGFTRPGRPASEQPS